VAPSNAGTAVYALTCAGSGGNASASATLTVMSPGSKASVTEGVMGLPADVTPMLSIAGIWQPVANQYLRLGANGDGNGYLAGPYDQNILLANGKEGLIATGWSCCDARTSDGSLSPLPLTPVNIAVLEQQPDGTLQLATSKYVSNPRTNGAGRVLVGDFNQDGIQDFFLPAYNESPFLPASSTVFLSNSDGTYANITVGDSMEGHGGTVASVDGVPTVFTVGYNANCGIFAIPPPSPLPCIPDADAWNGSNGFTIVRQTGMYAASSIAVGDFYGDRTYSQVYGDLGNGVNYPATPNYINGIYLYHLSGLIPVGNPINVGDPYFNDKPQWAQYAGYVNPNGETHSYTAFLDDFNHDGSADIVVEESIYPPAPNGGPNILQMFQNSGNYQFTDVTDLLDPQYDPYTAETDYDPQVRDIDGSGINSYLLMSASNSVADASNYLIVNDGSGNLQVALHDTLNRYSQQVVAWLASNPSFNADYVYSSTQTWFRAYQTAAGKLNFAATVWIRTPVNNPTLEQYVFVNIPLGLDVTSQFTKPIVVQNRNGSHLIRTFAGDDIIYSGNNGGYSKVDGGLGMNTVVYSGPSRNYSRTRNADGTWTIQDNVGTDGTDTLTRIQRLQFTDITVNLALSVATASPLLSGFTTGAYSQDLAATGGTGGYTWKVVSGSLPAGLTLSGAAITGTPTAAGTFSFTLEVTDSAGGTASQAFSLTVVGVSGSTALARVGVLSQFSAGGSWDTSIWVVNTSAAAVPVRLIFHGDDGTTVLKDASGNVTPTALTATQQGDTQSGITATTLDRVLNPNTSLVVGCGLGQSGNVEGWIDVLATAASVNGFAVFRYAPGGLTPGTAGFVTPYEGTVPLQTQLTPATMTLPFDNTNGFNNGVAIGTLSGSAATITATFHDINGNALGTLQTIKLAANAHTAFMLYSQYPFTANQQGSVVFTGTTMMGLGLRASPYGTLTSVPTILQ
jgi:hypothetical protein